MLPIIGTNGSEIAKDSPELPTRAAIEDLQAQMLVLPQVELKTDHYFADGMYCRVVKRDAGTTIVGKVHKREHFYIVVKGRVFVVSENGRNEFSAGSVIVSKPGTKRAVYAIEDSICLTVHRTNKTDLDEIEDELIEHDKTALFNSSNTLIGGKP